MKKISRNEILFKVDKDTKILLERKQGIKYDENYLEGPYYEDQNIIEIIDEKKKRIIMIFIHIIKMILLYLVIKIIKTEEEILIVKLSLMIMHHKKMVFQI